MTSLNQDAYLRPQELLEHLPTVRSIAGGFGMALRVLNDGQHWEFKREGFLVDWWPSSGSMMLNKQGGRRTKVFTLRHLRQVLARGPKQTISKRELRRWETEVRS